MKALKLTNSINILLNEDKFAKYTYRQIYDELGQEEFMDYIDTIVKKTIKDIKGLSNARVDRDSVTLYYTQSLVTLKVILWQFTLYMILEGGVKYWSAGSDPNQTNIGEYIKKTIIEGCKKGKIPIK